MPFGTINDNTKINSLNHHSFLPLLNSVCFFSLRVNLNYNNGYEHLQTDRPTFEEWFNILFYN